MNFSKNKLLIALLLFTVCISSYSQDQEKLKKQYQFAQKTTGWFEGFQKSIGTNDFSYHSLRNDIHESLLTRANNGDMAIEWETQKIPDDYKGQIASFVWIAALDLTDEETHFDVFINDNKKFSIPSSQNTDWSIKSQDGGKLEFFTLSRDQHGDAHGYMSLTAPPDWFTPGQALKIKIVGAASGQNTWIIVYKASDVISYLNQASKFESWIEVNSTKEEHQLVFDIEAPVHFAGKTLHYQAGDFENTFNLKKGNDVTKASFSVSDTSIKNLIILDGKAKLLDISDFTIASINQTILANCILLNEVVQEDNSIHMSSIRIYRPETAASMIRLSESSLGKGEIYLMNSSHQDIAWMDSPEKCVIERDTMLITPLIEAAQKDPDYRFDIEDALMLKEYIERHPERKEIIGQFLREGKISCGATYIQPYEEMYSGEALARQFYFGAKWLKDEFGYSANTYWSVDVPGRTLQMPQIMKKAGTRYMMISRHEKGIFNWYSPDGSSVMTYSPGHYGDAFAPLHKNFYEAAEYIASSSMYWEKYYTPSNPHAKMPLLSDSDMSPAIDYSSHIQKWESIDQLEKEPGKTIKTHLPKFKLATGPEFMQEFEESAINIPSIMGERPAVWLYIHGPSHQKALKASREGDILLTVAEKYACMDALSKGSFTDYPQERLYKAWEAKIYPDHGWGGKQGLITDAVFRQKFEYARTEALQLIENATNSIASSIKTDANKGIPIVVFNSLSWQRTDAVNCKLNFEQGMAYNISINDHDKKLSCQLSNIIYYSDKSIRSADVSFMANNVPSLGYKTFYAIPLKKPLKEYKLQAKNSFENDFYKLVFANGGLSSIYDKELGLELLNTENFNGAEVFTMQSEGMGAGEFDNIQQPTMEGFDKTGKYITNWVNITNGAISSSFKMRQQIRNAVIEQTITIYNQTKKIDFDIAILNWEGILYREYRMALPLNMKEGKVAYEVPYGMVEVNKDEIVGAAGERYKTAAADIHPRGIENWIGGSNDQFGVTMSSSVVAADFIDPTRPTNEYTLLQPILLASRRSCHSEGNEYLQTGNHYFSFSISSHQPGWHHSFHFGKQANEKMHVVVNPRQYAKASLPETQGFLSIDTDNVIVSAMKKAEDADAIIIRFYDMSGVDQNINIKSEYQIQKAYHTNLIEENIKEVLPIDSVIPFTLGHHSIETIKLIFDIL